MPSVLPSQRWQSDGNRYTLVNTVAATEEPVSVDEMKVHLRIDADDSFDDELIATAIQSARIEAENETLRTLVTSTWRFSMDRFPAAVDTGPWSVGFEVAPGRIRQVPGYSRNSGEFTLPLSPVQSVTSFSYLDNTGAAQAIAPTGYEIDLAGYPATITPAFGTGWPSIRAGRAGVIVEIVAGYGAAVDVPALFKSWIKLRVATMYRHRESVITFRGTIQELEFVDRLLDPFRIIEF